MADYPAFFNTGTATVAANGTVVTFQGVASLAALRSGDMFGTHVGSGVRILEVGPTTGTGALTASQVRLAYPWRGAAQTAAAYEIALTLDAIGYQQAIRKLLDDVVASGNLSSFGGLAGLPDRLAYFTGAGALDITPLTAFVRTLLDDLNAATFYATLGQIPNAQVRNDLPVDKAYRSGNILGSVAQSGQFPTGAVIERGSNSNGDYVRFADGTQICTLYQPGTAITCNLGVGSVFRDNLGLGAWSYPASFSSSPFVSVNVGSSFIWGIASTPGTSAVTRGTMSASSFVGNVNISNFAVGRWY